MYESWLDNHTICNTSGILLGEIEKDRFDFKCQTRDLGGSRSTMSVFWSLYEGHVRD